MVLSAGWRENEKEKRAGREKEEGKHWQEVTKRKKQRLKATPVEGGGGGGEGGARDSLLDLA